MSPITAYRNLFALTGPLYVVTAFLGRLPLAMSQMGAMLLVSSSTGSYAAGGLTAGALAVANAFCSPLSGALADRWGQRPVVLVQSVAGGLGLVALVLLTQLDAPVPALVGAAAATGAFLPQIGPLARVRWRPITAGSGARQHRLVETAFSYEGAADEASFVLGPALLGLLVVIAAPGTGLLVAAALLVVFGCAFALHPTARLDPRRPPRRPPQRPAVDRRLRRAHGRPAAHRQRVRLGPDRHHGAGDRRGPGRDRRTRPRPPRRRQRRRRRRAGRGAGADRLPDPAAGLRHRAVRARGAAALGGFAGEPGRGGAAARLHRRALHDHHLHRRRARGPAAAGRRRHDAARRRHRSRVCRRLGPRGTARRRPRPPRGLRGDRLGDGPGPRAGRRASFRLLRRAVGRVTSTPGEPGDTTASAGGIAIPHPG